jgi:hypothetical protein
VRQAAHTTNNILPQQLPWQRMRRRQGEAERGGHGHDKQPELGNRAMHGCSVCGAWTLEISYLSASRPVCFVLLKYPSRQTFNDFVDVLISDD